MEAGRSTVRNSPFMPGSPDSIVVPKRSSPVKLVLALATIGAVAAAAWWWLDGGGKGQPEDPARVLLLAPTADLDPYLEERGFDVERPPLASVIAEAQRFDPSVDGVAAAAEYADQRGIGYVALDLAHGERWDFAAVGHGDAEIPPGSTFAVLSVGDLGSELSFGGPIPELVHDKPAGEWVGLMLALFDQPELAKARTREASNDLMVRFESAATLRDLRAFEKARERHARQAEAWRELAEGEHGEPRPVELAAPYERVDAWPLATGELLLARSRDAWYSPDGINSKWDRPLVAAFAVRSAEGEALPCPELPDTLALDGGFALGPAGDALLIPEDRWVAKLWVSTGEGCNFEQRDQIRRLRDGALGKPRASGRTAEVLSGRLSWADAKMRAFRELRIPGVQLRERALAWVADDVVVIPAALDFEAAAEARTETDPTPTEPAEATPAARDALVFVRLPPPKVDDRVELAIVPVELLAAAGEGPPPSASAVAIIDSFPLAASPGSVVVLVDGPEGSSLVRVDLELDPERRDERLWANVLAEDFDLRFALGPAASELRITRLSGTLPHEAHDLAVSPTASYAAWVQPFGEAPKDEPQRTMEIVLLALDGESEPRRLTNNDRSDASPRFAGQRGQQLVFDSAYRASEELPHIEAARLLEIE